MVHKKTKNQNQPALGCASVLFSQNKDRRAESGGLIPLMSSAYFPEADASFPEEVYSAFRWDPVAPSNPMEWEGFHSAVQGKTTHE